MSGAVAHINRTVNEGDSQNTLEALQAHSVGLRAVLPECADTYQDDLSQKQRDCAAEGNRIYICGTASVLSVQETPVRSREFVSDLHKQTF